MKYCSKCGNQMADDMLFCQKCGTRFIGNTKATQNSSISKVAQIKQYNLVLDAQAITWEYLRQDGDRAGNIMLKQDKLCEELVELIKNTLDNVNDEERAFVEQEVYPFVLRMGYKLCKESEKLFSNYSGIKELFDMGNKLVLAGHLNPATFLNQIKEADYIYVVISGLQGLHCSRIKGALDHRVIYNNPEYRHLTIQVAQAFNDMWTACIKRCINFFWSPGIASTDHHWEMYNTILKGLSVDEIESLNESGWTLALNDWEKNHHGRHYKEDFLRKRDQQRDKQRKKEQEYEDKIYWEKHPSEYKQVEKNNAEIEELQPCVDELENEIQLMEEEKLTLEEEKERIETEIADKRNKTQRLAKKVFGKRRAQEEIMKLDHEIKGLENQMDSTIEQIKTTEKLRLEKGLKKTNLDRRIRELEKENYELRNK